MSVLLDEEKLLKLTEDKKTLFILQWLEGLPQILSKVDKNELKKHHNQLIQQLVQYGMQGSLSPPLRNLLSACLVSLYSVGDMTTLFTTINGCMDIIKMKDDPQQLANKTTCVICLGALFKHHGRMAGSLFIEIVQVLLKASKINELRYHICQSLEGILSGLGSSSLSVHKEIYKFLRSSLTDRQLSVRVAAANCMLELSEYNVAPLSTHMSHISIILDDCNNLLSCMLELSEYNVIYYTQELETLSQICLKGLEGSDYNVRCAISTLWGTLLAKSQKPLPSQYKGKAKVSSLEDVLGYFSQGFVRGAGGLGSGPELLKGGLAAKEVRVGVTQAYVCFLKTIGGKWVERHLPVISHNILDLLNHPKTTSTHIDAVYSRKCVQFILTSTFGQLLSEPSQLVAATHLCQVIIQLTNKRSEDGAGDEGKSSVAKQHMIICAASEVASLVSVLNTAALPLVVGDNGIVGGDSPAPLIQALDGVFINPSISTRLSGARCMYEVGIALPSLLASLVDYMIIKSKMNKGHPLGLFGHSYGLAALLTTARLSKLGIPLKKAEEVCSLGYELIQTPQDKGNLSVASIQSGWALIGAFLSLGSPYVRSQLGTILSCWYNLFPHSHKELIDEMSTGTSSSWKHTLEARIGALTSITGFLSSCGMEVSSSPDLIKRIMLPLDSVLALISELSGLVKVHGVQLKALSATIRLRLYQNLILLPPATYEGCFNTLLREVVAEFTMSETMATTMTSLLRSMCHHDDSILLGSWLEETDHKEVEEMLQPNSAAGSGSIEHDPASTYLPSTEYIDFSNPLPLGVAVIDASIVLFGRVFPVLSTKHQLQLLTHFKECIKQSKSSQHQPTLINIITAVLAALKSIVDSKSPFADEELISSTYTLIIAALTSSNVMLRCAAGEALGRLSQVVGNGGFVGQIVQLSVDSLKSSKEVSTGHILTLGCVHRYVGGMGAGQHLSASVSILQRVASNMTSPIPQVWSLHALSLIADSGGPLFRNHVDTTLSLILSILVQTPLTQTDTYRCLGNCLTTLLTSLGPELQIDSPGMSETRQTCLTACAIIERHLDPVVQASAISCLQQLQLFAPKFVAMAMVVPRLTTSLDSSHLLLRRSAANALRQFTQQDPVTVWNLLRKPPDKGLENVVLEKLDIETDDKLRYDLKEILFSLLTALAPTDPMRWLMLCNGVLAANQLDVTNEGASSSLDQNEGNQAKPDDDEDLAQFTTGEDDPSTSSVTAITPRWPTKVFAVDCSRKIYTVCKDDAAHFDLTLAEAKKRENGSDYLVMHLSELVRTSFIAATASVDELKLVGYQTLQDVIDLFASTPDPDYDGHILLEQYQAQIGAALRPAFSPETTPHVTAMACQVCSRWLGSGVSKDDLKRVQQLLVISLDKLEKGRSVTSIYGERVATMESLAVLKAWAELYIKMSADDVKNIDQGDDLINPHLHLLSRYWVAAIKDHAYLSLPSTFASQLPTNGGTFYTSAMSSFILPYYQSNWPSILRAASLWASKIGLRSSKQDEEGTGSAPLVGLMGNIAPPIDENHKTFYLLVGVAIQALCDPSLYDSSHTIISSLHSIHYLIQTPLSHHILTSDPQLLIELLTVFHRVLLTSYSTNIHLLTYNIVHTLTCDMDLPVLETDVQENTSCSYTLLVLASWILLKPSADHQLLSIGVQLLPNVVRWISSDAIGNVLPSVIYMMLNTVGVLQDGIYLSVCLKAWQKLCSSLSESSVPILQSSLKTILHPDGNQLHPSTQLILTSVILAGRYGHLVCIPHSQLFNETSEFFKACLHSNDSKVQLKALQVCKSLVGCPILGIYFIHEFGPEVVTLVQDKDDVSIATQSVLILEQLLDLTPADKKIKMLELLIPLFVSLLVDPKTLKRSSDRKKFQESLLQKLTAIGRHYPVPFKTLMTPSLKTRLEMAIKGSQATSTSKTTQSIRQQPSIALTMDFSKFK